MRRIALQGRRWGHRRSGRARWLVVALLTVAGALAVPPVADAATQASCSTAWGSLAKSASAQAGGTTTGIRAGGHACYDRLVVDGASWADVRYVGKVTQDASGKPVPLRGGAFLQIVTTTGVDPATGTSTFAPPASRRSELVDVTGFRTFRQVAHAGDFEGRLTVGLGVRARLPFRVFVLTEKGRPPRVVVDVAHHW